VFSLLISFGGFVFRLLFLVRLFLLYILCVLSGVLRFP
jgi:hypothetical protein